jgi:tetratricopeptide (TPR) repeat protein
MKTKNMEDVMKIFKAALILFVVLFSSEVIYSQTLDELIQKAEQFNATGDLEQAAKTMEQAVQLFPESSNAYSYLGLYRGSQAGTTQNYMEAGQLINVAYQNLDKAVTLDPNNPVARFHRGLMGINVPSFLGKLDQGIQDLEYLVGLNDKAPNKIPPGLLAAAYSFLGKGYQKKENPSGAVAAWQKVVELQPDSDLAQTAKRDMAAIMNPQPVSQAKQEKYTTKDLNRFKIDLQDDPKNPELLFKLGQAYFDNQNYEEARQTLKQLIDLDSNNIAAYKLLIQTVGELANKGYDQQIYENTDYRSQLAFEIVNLMDKAVQLSPNDPELRLRRGSNGVTMPFFVGKLDQAMEDLNWIKNNNGAPAEIKAQAIYWLGYAYQKKAMTNWIEVITNYSKTDAAKQAFTSMRPPMTHINFSKYQKPLVEIDFVLGYCDELAPQSAVWIEDGTGNYIKTIYVSGFSGFAKEKQVNLSDWSKASEYRGADAVTSASINVGHHIYVWDLRDYKGNKVKSGDYIVKIEVAYWPSLQYQSVAAKINIKKEGARTIVEEGDLIPYMEVSYHKK